MVEPSKSEEKRARPPSKENSENWGQMTLRVDEVKRNLDYLVTLSLQLRDSECGDLKKLVNDAYRVHQNLHDRYWALIHKLISLRQYCEMISPEPDSMKQLGEMLKEALHEQDIVALRLEKGSHYPEDKCIVKKRVPAEDLPPDTVESVITPPYITANGRLVKLGEIVATERIKTPTELKTSQRNNKSDDKKKEET